MGLIFVGLVAGASYLSYRFWRRRRALRPPGELSGPRVPALPAAHRDGDLRSLAPGDIVTHVTTDYLVEGSLILDDDGRATRLYRLSDGAAVRWLCVRPGDAEPLLLDHVARPEGLLPAAAHVPEHLVMAGAPYRLAARVRTTVRRSGHTGLPGAPPGSTAAFDDGPERAWLLDYAGVGARRLIAVAWPEHTEAFTGERVPRPMIEILRAS